MPLFVPARPGIVDGLLSKTDKTNLDNNITKLATINRYISTVSGAAAQDINISGLSGDSGVSYTCHARVVNAAGGQISLTLNINGSNANITYQRIYTYTTLVFGDQVAEIINPLSGDECDITICIGTPLTGFRRQGLISVGRSDGATASLWLQAAFTWDDTSTVITGLGIHSNTASSLAIGSSLIVVESPYC